MIRAAVILGALALCVQLNAVDHDRLADALREIENFNGRDGGAGERGAWQLMRITWRQHMPGVPFARAREEEPARACALKHIAWLRAELRRAGCADDVFMVALAWNAGLATTLSGRAPVSSYHYARRVENLYHAR